jgi:hypothetical protein
MTEEGKSSWRDLAKAALEGAINAEPIEISPSTEVRIKEGSFDITSAVLDAMVRENAVKLPLVVGAAIAGLLLLPIAIPVGVGALIVKRLGGTIADAVGAAISGIGAAFSERIPGWQAEISGALSGLWGGLFGSTGGSSPTGLFDPATGDQIFAPSGDSLGIVASVGQAVDGAVKEISGKIGGWKDDIVAEVKKLVPDSIEDLKFPEITIDLSGIEGPVTTAIDTVTGWIETIESLLERLGILQKNAANPPQLPPQGLLKGETPRMSADRISDLLGINAPPQHSSSPGTLASGETVTALPNTGTGSAPPPMVVPAPDLTAFNTAMATIPITVGTQMSAALGAANAYAVGIGTAVGSQIGAMVGNVGALMGSLVTTIGGQMSAALGVASTYATAIYSVVGAQIGAMVGNTAALMGAFVTAVGGAMSSALGVASTYSAAMASVIQANLAGAAANAFSTGAAIGQGLAAGMNSTLGAVQTAAAALASAAAQAAAARLQVASPSKVFTRMGEQVGDGFVIGIQSRYGAAGRAGTGLAGASIPDGAASLRGRSGASGQTIQIFALKSDELVRLMDKAERGGNFAEQLPQLLRQGAY